MLLSHFLGIILLISLYYRKKIMPDFKPEEKARIKIDKLLKDSGWDVIKRDEMSFNRPACAIEEALMQGNLESDYLLFAGGKAIAVLEAKRKENNLELDVQEQAEKYCRSLNSFYQYWSNPLRFSYISNGEELYFKDLSEPDMAYIKLPKMHTPKELVSMADINDGFASLPAIPPVGPKGLRACQYEAINNLEISIKLGNNKALIILATGAGKTFTACTAAYRLLNYVNKKRILFLVDRNNLGKQAEGEFGTYKLTETKESFTSEFIVSRLKPLTKKIKDEDGSEIIVENTENKNEAKNSSVVISTIQRLFAVLRGDPDDDNDDTEVDNDEVTTKSIELPDNPYLPSDFFDVIIIDECHRSIYGLWKSVLDYFKGAQLIGLTATPTPEALAFFNNNRVVNYTLDKSIADGVNVPARVFRIKTEITETGTIINEGEKVNKKSNLTGQQKKIKQDEDKAYEKTQLDRSVVVPSQIETVIQAYKDNVFETLFPDRTPDWNMVPKTLIFAKKESHATDIVEAVKKVFKKEFPNEEIPENFVKKITCSQGNTNQLISDFRNHSDFRIAVTVTLVATGTDVRPLECLIFMRDVNSEVLYTQMKGRGCRTIDDDKLKAVTTNAENKDFFYLIDAVGVTEHEKSIPSPLDGGEGPQKIFSLVELLEHLSHGEVSNENLDLLCGYLSKVNKKAETKDLLELNTEMGITVKQMCLDIYDAISPENTSFPEFVDKNAPNLERKRLITKLIDNLKARKLLLEINAGFIRITIEKTDTLLSAGFSQEQAREYTEIFELYITENRDEIEALRILYNQENIAITHDMLLELTKKLLRFNNQLTAKYLWECYLALDGEKGSVKKLFKEELDLLTNIIQLVRYAYNQNEELFSLNRSFGSLFNLYCGQKQHSFKDYEIEVVREVALYILQNGCVTNKELYATKPDLLKKLIPIFGANNINEELQTLTKYIYYGKAV